MKNIFRICIVLILFILSLPAMASEGNAPILNLMIDVDMPASPTAENISLVEQNLRDMYVALNQETKTATFYLTKNVASSRIRLYLAQMAIFGDLEYAISGNTCQRIS